VLEFNVPRFSYDGQEKEVDRCVIDSKMLITMQEGKWLDPYLRGMRYRICHVRQFVALFFWKMVA
jgi:hypothetical protein